MKRLTQRSRASGTLGVFAAVLCATLALMPDTSRGQSAPDTWRIDPMRGPVDLGLTDPSLVGAIDVHLHLDPDSPGPGGTIRILDIFEAATIAKSRGMRGFVYKAHHDTGSAGGGLVRRRWYRVSRAASSARRSRAPTSGARRPRIITVPSSSW